MQMQEKQRPGHTRLWFRVRQALVYFPGALVLIYGFWLSLTA